MASIFDLRGFNRVFGIATLLAGVSTVALAASDATPDPRDVRIQQLEAQVQQLVADHQRLQAADEQLATKAQQLESEVAALQQGQAAQTQTIQTVEANQAAAPTAPPHKMAKAEDAEHPLTWHGISIYGAYDVGVGWVSHGLPENGFNYEGESLVNRNGAQSRFLIAPNNLSQTSIGIRGKEEIMSGWFGVFNASTGINPQSGQLANLAATNTLNAGLPRASYSFAGDGTRAGQAFNDELYAGIGSEKYGTLTFGRQRALGTDAMLIYDPAGGAYSFSFIGYNGLMAGGGDTQDTRWDSALKYRLAYGPVHFGAMYKFDDGQGGCYSASSNWSAATCTPEQPHNSAYGFDLGGVFGHFSADVVFQRVNQAISVLNPLLGPTSLSTPYQSTLNSINTNPINGANLISTNNTEYGIVTDNTAIMIGVKYTWDQLKFFGGYEHILYQNPAHPLGVGATAGGGYLLSGVEDNNLDSDRNTQVFWTGVKYAYNKKTDITLSYYRQMQNDFRVPPTCSPAAGFRASCAGALDEASLYGDYHFTLHFDAFAGVAYSIVSGGLNIAIPHGPGVPYLHNNNTAPTVGVRYSF
jgi:predicted porin